MASRSRSERPRPGRRAVLGGALAAALVRPARAEAPLRVFAAASLRLALAEIAAGWDGAVSMSHAASGTLARQVAAGAPADVVILAAADWMDWLAAQGALGGAPVSVATNRLVIVGAPGAGPVALEAQALLRRLGDGRLAIGDPASVPAGRYAREALEALDLWSALDGRLLPAQDAPAALAWVAGGDAPLGIVYASDAAGAAVSMAAAIPAGSHAPIVYPGAVTRQATPSARAFLDRVAAADAIFAAHGFGP